MDASDDNTAILRMQKDFYDFLSSSKKSEGPKPEKRLKFGESFLDSSALQDKAGGERSSQLSVQQILGEQYM